MEREISQHLAYDLKFVSTLTKPYMRNDRFSFSEYRVLDATVFVQTSGDNVRRSALFVARAYCCSFRFHRRVSKCRVYWYAPEMAVHLVRLLTNHPDSDDDPSWNNGMYM